MKTDTRRYWQSSSFKMAILFTVLLGISVGVLGYFSYYFNRDHYVQSPGEVIDTEFRYLLLEEHQGRLIATLNQMSNEKMRIYLLRDHQNKKLAGNFDVFPEKISVLREGIILFDLEHQHYAAKVHMFADGRTLIAGVNITRTTNAYHRLQILSFISVLVMAIVVLVSFLISNFVVRRTNDIAATALSIMKTGDLSQRIRIDARWDDLGNMAYVLNLLLSKVESLLTGIRQVSDNIAHDLRTPLTRLLNMLEMMRREPMIEKDAHLKNISDSMIDETHRLLDTFNALLRITSIEMHQQHKNFTSIDLSKIMTDVVELYEPLAEEKFIRIFQQIEYATINGDRDLMFQAMANILSNAIAFTPLNGQISIKLGTINAHTYFTISDTGPGIAETEQKKVFDRFYRSDASRSHKGNGLGLSLVAAIIGLHNGRITLKNSEPGLIFEVLLQ